MIFPGFLTIGKQSCAPHFLRMRQQLGKLDLLILDELGYVPASKAGAELLFDVIAIRAVIWSSS